MLKTLRSWWQDKLLRGVVKNTGYLFSSNTISAALSMLNSIFATRLLGVDGLGLVTTIQTFASNINRLLSFRMSEVVVKFLGQAMAASQGESDQTSSLAGLTTDPKSNNTQAVAIVKGIGLAEALTSLLAYAVLVALAPWAARVLAKDPAMAALFTIYGLVLVGNMFYETSTGVLQAHKRFDKLAAVNTTQSVLTALFIFLAFIFRMGLVEVLGAYLLGKTFAGIAVFILAFRQMNLAFGRGWWHTSLAGMADWRTIFGFALNTNLNGTVNLITRDNAPLYLAALSPAGLAQAYVGYFKLGLSIINFVTLPIDPFIWPTYAEITRTIALRQWAKTRSLLKRVSMIAAFWTLSAGAVIALFGWWLIPLVYGPSAAPVYPVALILLVGYGIANILNWNRPLLLALGKSSLPLIIAASVGAVEILLILWLVPTGGYLVMAGILSAYLFVSISLTAWRGWHIIQQQESLDRLAGETESRNASV